MKDPREKLIIGYLEALANNVDADELKTFFHLEAQQVELPNRLNPNGGKSDLATILQRSEQGKGLLTKQVYRVINILFQGDQAAVEAEWEGTLAIPVAGLNAGDVMRAHFAMFFTFEGDKIKLQRNYDCFEPW